MENEPLSPLQKSLLSVAPEKWTYLGNISSKRKALDVLEKRGMIEVQKVGDGPSRQWRRKPVTFDQAVRLLINQLPQGVAAIQVYHAREELLMVRRLLEHREKRARSRAPADEYMAEVMRGSSTHVDGGVGFAA